jgi:alanyl-tRNA synthetase
MNANELRESYLSFFETRGHHRIPSASLLPENDPTVLFTTAGMHPLVPFLLGESHPMGKRLTNFQKCLRTNDIDEVGDPSHLTFFEMLGNWSLGDYFKEESLTWSFEFLTRVLGLDPSRLAVTVFSGDENAERDERAALIWRRLGLPAERIFFKQKADNWWGPVGATGPCGPDSEIFYDTGKLNHPGCGPTCACGRWLEIWNNVFMEYEKIARGGYRFLRQRNVDTGLGLERTLAVLQGYSDVFRIETLWPLVERVEQFSGRKYEDQPAPFRIVVDHLRSAVFAIADGALPGNVEAGYVVRRLIRRAVRYGRELGIHGSFLGTLSGAVVDLFGETYPELVQQRQAIADALDEEESKFSQTLERGLRQCQKMCSAALSSKQGTLEGQQAFNLYETYGFPIELTVELAGEQGLKVDMAGFEACYQAHRDDSRARSDLKFRGGLADSSDETVRLHTAAHLLQQALRQVLGSDVRQMGSNITAERLRFDFSWPERLSPEQLAAVEQIVNEQIQADLPVVMEQMPLAAALQAGALAFFAEKYSEEQVKVYSIGQFSKEVCGGPHVTNTGLLGQFKIVKEENVKHGVRRIRAVLV